MDDHKHGPDGKEAEPAPAAEKEAEESDLSSSLRRPQPPHPCLLPSLLPDSSSRAGRPPSTPALRRPPPSSRKVLHKLYSNMERPKRDRHTLASEVHKRLRLIVAGGDGTAGWLLGVVSDLKLAHPPPVATNPLETGNNLPYSFGWNLDSTGVK